jgi:tetratricopeptide (TPR) repeat protein
MVAGVLRMDHAPAEASQAFQVFDRWAEGELGAYHPARALALTRWAWCQAQQGQGDEACRLYQLSHDILVGSVGGDHPAARCLAAYLAAACTVGPVVPVPPVPPRDLTGLPPYNPIAGPHQLTDESVAAEVKRLEAAAARQEITGASTADAEYSIGMMLVEFGLFELAVRSFEEYERTAVREHGADHDYVIAAVGELARCHLELGNYADSCREAERERRMLMSRHPDHPRIEVLGRQLEERCPPANPAWFFGLAAQLAGSGEFEQAVGCFYAYQRWVERELGFDHRYVFQAMVGRAHCHSQLGQIGSACVLYQQALDGAEPAGVVLDRGEEIRAWLAESCDQVEPLPGDPAGYYETWVPPALHRIEPALYEIGLELDESGHPDEAASAFAAYEAWRGGRDLRK